MFNTTASEYEQKSANRAMSEWLEREYDAPQQENDGPEALAWDDHGLRAANQRPAVQL